jgi:hypothetical protein
MHAITLSNIQSMSDFLETPEGKSLFGSVNAVLWHERKYRKELVDSGALIKVRGRWYRNRPKYDEIVIEIAQKNAHKSLEASNESI